MLSRSPEQWVCHEEVAAHIDATMSQVPATPHRMTELKQHTYNDTQLQIVIGFISNGWPEYCEKVPEAVRVIYQVRGELSEVDGLVIRGSHIVIPTGMRKIILERIHDGHQGLVKSGEKANQSVWWPRMSDIV